MKIFIVFIKIVVAILIILTQMAFGQQIKEEAGISPWGPEDEIGTLNMMSETSQLSVLSNIKSGKVYDLSTEYFVGMPSFHSLGDPGYQYYLTIPHRAP